MRTKYPRTPHLPWSEGATNDDRVLGNVDHFLGKEVVVTEKMDGENTTMYRDYLHARSLDSKNHPSRDWVRGFHGSRAYLIPHGMRVCGENMYAKHSILYEDLDSYFYGFSVWVGPVSLNWHNTMAMFSVLEIVAPRVLFKGVFDEASIKRIKDYREGYVVRSMSSFHYDDFALNVAKFVRPNHVQTDEHWMNGPVVPNKLREGK